MSDCYRSMSFWLYMLACCLLFGCVWRIPAYAAGEPDAAAIFAAADTAPETVLYEQDFETDENVKMEQWYGGQVPNKLVFSGVTTEQAFSGTHSYKLQVSFDAGRFGTVYYRVPVKLPIWSDLKIKMYVKAEAPAKTSFFHGSDYLDLEENTSGNTMQGAKSGEEKGWEVWEFTARRSSAVARAIEGPAVMLQLPDNSPATTVTLYVDKITITGKLPADWKTKWEEVSKYYTVEVDKQDREAASKRLAAMRRWHSALSAQLAKVAPPATKTPTALNQFAGVVSAAKSRLDQSAPLMDELAKDIESKNGRFSGGANKPERPIMEARYYVQLAASYGLQKGAWPDKSFLTFTLDPTFSYKILPEGPMAHNEELSYYDWNEAGQGLEDPQILPDTNPVPAFPGNRLAAFGCRGTYAPISFVVRAGKELTSLTLEASDLKSASGKVIRADAVDIRVVAPWFRPFNQKPRLMNELLLHDPEFVTPVMSEQRNKVKDPKFGDDAAKLLPVTIPAESNRQFYVTVRVPDKAAKGLYKGKLTGKAADGTVVAFDIELTVPGFDLEPTPYAYSAFYRSTLMDEEAKKKEGIHSWHKTLAQMSAEFKSMGEHGFSTLNLYDGRPTKTDKGWDFSLLGSILSSAKSAGLTRSPFTWLAHPVFFLPDPRPGAPKTDEEVVRSINEFVPAVNEFCKKNGYPKPAFYGWDEASGDTLIKLKAGYGAVNKAGGITSVACNANYFSEIGSALSLPIVYGGAQTLTGQRSIAESHKLGYECWIYNTPSTNMAASPSVYRRRYGLAMWKNNEQGAAPWEYSGVPSVESEQAYIFNYANRPCYAFAFPTWSGKPIDTVIYEAFREAVYDTRYLTTLQKHLKRVKDARKAAPLTNEVEGWLAGISVHDDLQQLRWKMIQYTEKLAAAK